VATDRQIAANRLNRQRWRGHSLDGIARLRAAARRHKPWLQSTGPRTASGKKRSSRNALTHGGRSAGVVAAHRRIVELLGAVRDRTNEVSAKA